MPALSNHSSSSHVRLLTPGEVLAGTSSARSHREAASFDASASLAFPAGLARIFLMPVAHKKGCLHKIFKYAVDTYPKVSPE